MKKSQIYAKSIDGTVSYWHQVKEQLKSTPQQHGALTNFSNLSCAELHSPDFHVLFSNVNTDYIDFKSNLHILDCFFTERTEVFAKHWL